MIAVRTLAVLAALLVAVVAAPRARAGTPEAPPTETPEQAATRHYEKGKAALLANDYPTAATEFDLALEHYDDPNLAWNAARAHHNAHHWSLARDRYQRCLAYATFPADKRQLITDTYLPEVEKALRPPEPIPDAHPVPARPEPSPSRLGPWLLIGSGALLAVGDLVLHTVAEGQRDDVRKARAESPVTALTQVEARDHESTANTLDTVGVVGLAVGGAAIVGGVVWLLTGFDAPETRGSVHVTGGVTPAGGAVTATLRF